MTEKSQEQLIKETHKTVIQLSTVLLGVPGTGDKGIVGEVKDNRVAINGIAKSHNKLKRNFWILVASLVGSGAIGSGIYNMLNGG